MGFDAIEIQHPDELPEFIDWALDGEGRKQNYGCYVLDSWAMYFARKHRETIQAVRQRTGDERERDHRNELDQAQQAEVQRGIRRLPQMPVERGVQHRTAERCEQV